MFKIAFQSRALVTFQQAFYSKMRPVELARRFIVLLCQIIRRAQLRCLQRPAGLFGAQSAYWGSKPKTAKIPEVGYALHWPYLGTMYE